MSFPNPIIPSDPMRYAVTKTSELLPCPFCGAPAEISEHAGNVVRISCTNWRACAMFPERKAERDTAIADWNRRSLEPQPEVAPAPMSTDMEQLRLNVAKAIHAADYGPYVDLELEWDANEAERMRQADAALKAAGIADLLADLADMNAYIRQRDDAMTDLNIAMQRLDDFEEGHAKGFADALIPPSVMEEAVKAEMLAALELVRSIIVDGAAVGFNPLDGDWAERLYRSQAATAAAVKKAGGNLAARSATP